jgi:pimeloyl-ACP methyl ester carboxylesterase
MKTSLCRMVTSDQIELVGLLYEPEVVTKSILVHVHGMAGNFYENRFLDSIAQTLTSEGIAFFTFNNRGCEFIKDLTQYEGERRKIVRFGDTFERFTDCLLDIRTAIDFISSRGFSRIHLSGHSLGGPKIAYYSTETKDTRLTSLLFLSPADMVGLAVADKNYDHDINVAQKMIAEGKGGELMPGLIWDDCYLSANTFIDLSTNESKVSIFNLYQKNNPLSVLAMITLPSITIMGRKDSALSVPIEEMMSRIKGAMVHSSRVETVILGDANHGYYRYEQQLADQIKTWIQKM